MSYLIQALGHGLIGDLFGAVRQLFPPDDLAVREGFGGGVRSEGEVLEANIRIACTLMGQPGNENIARARDLFAGAVRSDPDCLCGHVGLACVADRLGQNGTARHHLAEALRIRRDDPLLMFSLAMAYEKLARRDRAERLYEDTLRVCPALRNARERLAALQMLNGDLAAAARHYRLLAAAGSDRLGPRLIYANLLLAAGDLASALVAFEEALTVEADNWSSESDRATELAEQGRFEEAADWLQHALEEEPDNADLHVHLGDVFVELGLDRPAMDAFRRAVELCPDFLEAYVKVGTHYLRLGCYTEACQWFTHAVEVNDRLLVGYVGLAVAQLEAGNQAAAEETLNMAASIEPNSTLLFSEAARLSLKAGVLDPPHSPAWAGAANKPDSLAQRALQTDRVSEVIELLDALIERAGRAVEYHPNHARLHYQLGLLLRNRGRIAEANKALAMAVRIHPGYCPALVKLGLGLRELGRDEDGVEYLKQALKHDAKTAALHHRLGLMFSQQPGFDIAHRHFRVALGRRAEEIDAAANLELALENMNLVRAGPVFAVDPDEYGPEPLRHTRRFGGPRM